MNYYTSVHTHTHTPDNTKHVYTRLCDANVRRRHCGKDFLRDPARKGPPGDDGTRTRRVIVSRTVARHTLYVNDVRLTLISLRRVVVESTSKYGAERRIVRASAIRLSFFGFAVFRSNCNRRLGRAFRH